MLTDQVGSVMCSHAIATMVPQSNIIYSLEIDHPTNMPVLSAFYGFKMALAAAAAVGVGATVVTHWEDIKLIAENFSELKENLHRNVAESLDNFKQRRGRKCEQGTSAGNYRPSPDIAYSNDYNDPHFSDSGGSQYTLRHRNVQGTVPAVEDSDLYTDSSQFESYSECEEVLFDSSQLSMPSSANCRVPQLATDTDTDSEDQLTDMSEFSLISSDDEWTGISN